MRVVQRTCSLALGISLLALIGCASTSYEGKYPWRQGWRKAEVVAVQTAAEMERPNFFTCIRTATPEQRLTATFATVQYRQMLRTQRRAVRLQPTHKVFPGDLVYIKVDDCTALIVAAP